MSKKYYIYFYQDDLFCVYLGNTAAKENIRQKRIPSVVRKLGLDINKNNPK